MSKSSTVEIIAILWLIAGLLSLRYWAHWIFFALAVENTLESMVWAYKERKAKR